MNEKENILTIEDLTVHYKTDTELVKAVNGISLSVDAGETLGLVGETGAGKTTTALSILRLLPDRVTRLKNGKVFFKGRDLLALSEEEMREEIRGEKISMIFQDPMTALNPVMTVGEQIAEALRYHNSNAHLSKEEIEKKVDETLELVGIPAERKREFAHQFSGGMKQRVVIAIALVCEPELLIADEPTTALDVTIQAQVLAMMSELQEKLGAAILLITHDLGVVAQICDKVAVMYAGEIVESGTVADIFEGDKHHPYTEGLFGSIPSLDVDTDRLSPIEGLMADPTKLPEGCYFADRCKYCTEECKAKHPADSVWGTHSIKCHRFADNKEGEAR